jgi:plasmid maintenance system antidote protein VapI
MNLKEYFKEEPKGAISEMAKYLGITATWLSLIIHGRKQPSPKLAKKIEEEARKNKGFERSSYESIYGLLETGLFI